MRSPGTWGPPWPPAARSANLLRDLLLAERHRWALWTPVLMGGGVLLYLSPATEPAPFLATLALATVLAGLGCAVLALLADRAALATLCILLAALPAGYLVAAWRTAAVTTVSLSRPASLDIEGRVVMVEGRERGHRLTLDSIAVRDRELDQVPGRVRIGVAKGADQIQPGDRILVRARLEAPQPPSLLGEYDWARDAWFQGLGAVGWSLGTPTLLQAGDGEAGLALQVESLRTALTARIAAATPGPGGAVAAALVTGHRGAVDDQIWQDMQQSGLAHLISISGLHFTLVAGVVFFLARWGLGLLPAVCLRLPAQKGAALAAILACAFYLVISGASVPAQRSFVMATVVFTAILVDRDPISLRLLALAAIAVLAVAPQSLLGPSFQLTFAAMVALIALFEALARRRAALPSSPKGPVRQVADYLAGIASTTVVATIATAPFGAWHFGTVASWGVVANMLAIPLTSFVVMPAAVLGIVLLPLGLDQLAFTVMGRGVEVVLATAAMVASWPHANVAIPGMSAPCVALVVAGGLWLAIWQGRWRLAGAPVALAGLLLALVGEPPRMFVAPDAMVAGGWTDDGRLVRTSGSLDGRVGDAWRTRTGATGRLAKWQAAAPGSNSPCDGIGCTASLAGHLVAVLTGPGDAGDDCRHASLVIDLVAERRCPPPVLFLGRRQLRAAQGLEIDLSGPAPVVSTVAESRGDRPWTQRSPIRPQP
jgi:competence protein ComEC